MTITFHDIPYAQPSPDCPCPIQRCGGIILDPDCPDHGYRRNPAMQRHIAGNARCQQLTRNDQEDTR